MVRGWWSGDVRWWWILRICGGLVVAVRICGGPVVVSFLLLPGCFRLSSSCCCWFVLVWPYGGCCCVGSSPHSAAACATSLLATGAVGF